MLNNSSFPDIINSSFAFENETTENFCPFPKTHRLSDLLSLLVDSNCYRHSLGFTVFLCVTNLLLLLFGIVGNSVVLYVVIFKLKIKMASSIFILNLAVADLLVIVCCIPATLVANIFTPWIFSEATCKIIAYTQRLSVFCSIYSLVAISFDRCRALQSSLGTTPTISSAKACKIVSVIWISGFVITLPWAFPMKPSLILSLTEMRPAFCQEIWKTATHEAAYFLLVQVLARFAVPLTLITVCSLCVWKNLPVSVPPQMLLVPSCIDFRVSQRNRQLRVMKVFTALNFAFLLFWLPLYVITARLNFMQDDEYNGTELEQQLASYLIPIAQLLGKCNNCINPVLYCFLSETFREPFANIFRFVFCCCLGSGSEAKQNDVPVKEVVDEDKLPEPTSV